MSDAAVTEIVLLGYPVRLGARQQEHLDEVTREFMLLSLSQPEVREQVPGRLLQLVDMLPARYSAELEEPRRLWDQALREGREQIDLTYPAVPGAREIIRGWWDTMREVDGYCRDDALLALETPADVRVLQRWLVDEFLAQLDGAAPTPWPGLADG